MHLHVSSQVPESNETNFLTAEIDGCGREVKQDVNKSSGLFQKPQWGNMKEHQ